MVEIIAHRGFSGKYPENTLLSIKKAVELGVDWIEVDAWLTMDHHVIVIHDSKLNRTTNGRGSVIWKNFSEIKKYRTKQRNQPVPTLEEALEAVRNTRTRLNIELKSIWAAKPVAELIKKLNMEKKVMISSSKPSALRIVKSEIPKLRIAYIFFTANNKRWGAFVTLTSKMFFRAAEVLILRIAESLKADYVNLSYPFAVNGFIKRLHKHGFKVNVWAVNTRALMKKMIKHKIDGIITDYPDQLRKVLAEKPRAKKLSLKRIRLPRIRLRRKKSR